MQKESIVCTASKEIIDEEKLEEAVKEVEGIYETLQEGQ